MAQNKLRGALIGFGSTQSKGHVPAYLERLRNQQDVEIVAIADISEARRQIAQQQLPECRIYTEADILIEEEAGAIDFIDVAIPSAFHAQIAKHALEKNIHVLCEQPLAGTYEEAQELVQLAAKHQRILFPSQEYKHLPVVKAIRETIEAGLIGHVRSVSLNLLRSAPAEGVAEWRKDWRREHRFGMGGVGFDLGPQALSLMMGWLGGFPSAVVAKIFNSNPEAHDTEDSLSAIFSFPNAFANVHLTWSAGVTKTSYSIQGDRGAVTVDDDDMQIASNGMVERKMVPPQLPAFSSVFEDFQTAIIKQDFANKDLLTAVECVRWIQSAYRG